MTEREVLKHEQAPERWPIGRAILQRVRTELNDPMGHFGERHTGGDAFRALYLTERDTCIPDDFITSDELYDDIHSMYYHVLEGVAAELRERSGAQHAIQITIDPSYEDTTYFVMHTSDRVLLSGGRKAGHFWWESEAAMAEELEDWYRGAEPRLTGWSSQEFDLDEGYVITLTLERVLNVQAESPQEAIDRGVRWEDNEDDPDVQLLYEEVVEYRCEPVSGPQQVLGQGEGGDA
jgi:hypothetical protein